MIKKLFSFLARCHTNLAMDTFLFQPMEHYHAPIPERIPVTELSTQVKSRAVTSEELTSVILNSSLRIFPLSATSELPRTQILSQTIHRQHTTSSTGSDDSASSELRKTDRGGSTDFI